MLIVALALEMKAGLLMPVVEPMVMFVPEKVESVWGSLKASPSVSFAPARIVVVAEVKGGSDDSEEFYCPTVEWEWGDGTVSTAEADCNPYEAGKSQIKRRYTVEHQFRNAGGFKISLRLKKGNKVAAMANAVVQVRAGLGPGD